MAFILNNGSDKILETNIDELPRYSFSKIKSYFNCPYGFFKNYFEKDRNKADHGMSEFGSYMHYILEMYEKGQLQIYEMLPYYKEHYDENVKSTFALQISENFSKDFADDYYKSGEKYLESFDGFPNLNILEAEYEFDTVINNQFVFNGKIDLIATNQNDELIIVDHKSKSRFQTKKELKEYAKQLYLYSYAVHEKYGKYPKYMYFNRFRRNETDEIKFTKKELAETLQWAIDSVTEIENCMNFDAIPDTFYCNNFCSYREGNCDKKDGGMIV